MSGTNRLNVFSYIITVDVLIQKENICTCKFKVNHFINWKTYSLLMLLRYKLRG